jgi:DinB superfamily
VDAPPEMRPARRYATPAQALEAFRHTRTRTMRYVESTADDLRAHTGEHELLQTLDGYQWLLLVAAHSERHMAQWAELKKHPHCPAVALETYA